VDRFWHVPHYEKMLYDQAQLANTYIEAWQINAEPLFEQTARDILDYVRRDMTSPGGAFYSAEDADSLAPGGQEKREGAFYVWAKAELDETLGPDAPLFNRVYGVETPGNSPTGSDPHGELKGLNTLIRRMTDKEAANLFAISVEDARSRLAQCRALLLQRRALRPRPHLDDKIVSAWNGLTISAFARAGMALADPTYVESAQRAADFVRRAMYSASTLLRSYREGPGPEGFADDYAAMAGAALDLYQATGDIAWLQWSKELQTRLDELFLDNETGGYFSARAGDTSILVRIKESHDGAEPAASSLAARNTLRLARMLDDATQSAQALKTVAAFAETLRAAPTSMPAMLNVLQLSLTPARQIVIAGPPADPETQALAQVARAMATPETTLLFADAGPAQSWLAAHLPFMRTATPADGKPTALVCENFVCRLPITNPEELRSALR
jgi:uncharacterized protein YyaL (SSP411 family)